MNRFRSLILALSINVHLTLLGQETTPEHSPDLLVSHKQVVPTGWSAINSNLQLPDGRIAQLIPTPPEGTLFFKLTGDGTWDINQF